MKFHDRGASWFLTQVKANYAKIAEMNINCERFQTSAWVLMEIVGGQIWDVVGTGQKRTICSKG